MLPTNHTINITIFKRCKAPSIFLSISSRATLITQVQENPEVLNPPYIANYSSPSHYDTHLNRINIIGDAHQTSLLLFHQCCHIIDTLTHPNLPLGGHIRLARSTGSSALPQSLPLGSLALWPVLVQQAEQLSG